jgi:hypothetical protein
MGYNPAMSIDSIQMRVQAYVSFALDGQMVREFPEAAGRPVQIVLAPDDRVTPELEAYVEVARPKLAEHGVAISIHRRPA